MRAIKLSMIFLILCGLVSCSTTAPKPPKNPTRGMYINNGTPYIRYEYIYQPSKKWNVLLDESQSLNHVCTYKKDYVEGWAYGEKLKVYVEKLEKDLKNCRGY